MSSKRRRRRESPRERRKARAAKTIKMTQPIHRLPIYEIVGEEGIEIIHNKSMQILAEDGIAFHLEEARQILKKHGAEIRGEMAYFEPGLIDEYTAKAPQLFTQLARNPENNLIIGGDHLTFAPVYGPPFVYDRKRGRRHATLSDFQNFVKLAYSTPYLHHSGGAR